MTVELPDIAQPAWAAYLAMIDSKRRHFDFLRALEDRTPPGQEPSATDNARLQALLTEHDDRVAGFKAALGQLRAADPEAHATLVARLAEEGQGDQ